MHHTILLNILTPKFEENVYETWGILINGDQILLLLVNISSERGGEYLPLLVTLIRDTGPTWTLKTPTSLALFNTNWAPSLCLGSFVKNVSRWSICEKKYFAKGLK
jgi:hypothetical protein